MARFWFFNAKARKGISDKLESLSMRKSVVRTQNWNALEQSPIVGTGRSVFLLHPGWLISHSDFNGKGWMPLGMHGYHPEDAYSDRHFFER